MGTANLTSSLQKRQYINKAEAAGELAGDPAIHTTSTGKQFVTFTLVTKYKQYSEHHKIIAWPPHGSKVTSLHRGDFVRIVGRLQTRSWDDKQTGQKRYITQIAADQVVLPNEAAEPATGGTSVARAILKPAETEASDDIAF